MSAIPGPSRAPAPLFDRSHVPRVPLFRFDPGWLFLGAGIVTLAATVLIPAQHDLDIANWQRDRANIIEKHRLERIDHYAQYLRAIDQRDESVLLSLASVQLNASPTDRVPLNPPSDPASLSASVFPHLEPAPAVLPDKPVVTERSSLLARLLTINDHTRLWLLASGVLSILIGLLPPSVRPAHRAADAAE
jgi:hypothetical protein